MGRLLAAFLFLAALAFYGFTCSTPTLCEQIKQKTPKLTNYNFTDDWVKKINLKKTPLLDMAISSKLFNEENNSSDSTYTLGWFDVSPTRLGTICCTKAAQCDHRIYYLSLYVIDNCNTVVYRDYHFGYVDDESSFYYEEKATLSTDKKTFTHVTVHSSEWINFTDTTIQDTTFTEIYKIDLSLKKIDTTYQKTTFELIKK